MKHKKGVVYYKSNKNDGDSYVNANYNKKESSSNHDQEYYAANKDKKLIKDDDYGYGYGYGNYGGYGYDYYPDKYIKKENDLTYYKSSKNDHDIYENADH